MLRIVSAGAAGFLRRDTLRRLRVTDLRRLTGDFRTALLARLLRLTGFFLRVDDRLRPEDRRLLAAIILRVAAFCAALLRFLATVFFLRAFDRPRGRGFTNRIDGI